MNISSIHCSQQILKELLVNKVNKKIQRIQKHNKSLLYCYSKQFAKNAFQKIMQYQNQSYELEPRTSFREDEFQPVIEIKTIKKSKIPESVHACPKTIPQVNMFSLGIDKNKYWESLLVPLQEPCNDIDEFDSTIRILRQKKNQSKLELEKNFKNSKKFHHNSNFRILSNQKYQNYSTFNQTKDRLQSINREQDKLDNKKMKTTGSSWCRSCCQYKKIKQQENQLKLLTNKKLKRISTANDMKQLGNQKENNLYMIRRTQKDNKLKIQQFIKKK